MQIITIYQGASGSGEELAQAVAQSLGYGCVSRASLVEASLQYGISQAKLTDILDREPTWWAGFTRNLEPYRIALQAAFCQVAREPGIVYHGHIGHELLPTFQHVIKVLLTAPMEMRIAQVRGRQTIDETAARRYVEEIDKARTRRLQELFGKDWRDASRYDLVVNLGHMSLATATHLIVETAHAPDYQMTTTSKQAFEDFALAARVRATLGHTDNLSHARFDIKANEGAISISGTIPLWLSEIDIVEQIRNIPGVKDVKADLAPLYTDVSLMG